MVKIEDLQFAYPNSEFVFNGLNWYVKPDETWAVLGLSGSGKSTLLNLLSGLLKPASGRILISGEALKRVRPQTGYIMQDNGLLPWSTLESNIRLGFRIRKFYGPDGKHSPESYRYNKAEEDRALEYWLERLEIEKIRSYFPDEISGGQLQRAVIARTMILEPNLLLMDEPFSSLDINIRESLQNLILEIDQKGSSVRIIVTHNMEEAAFLGKKILILQKPGIPPLVYDNFESGNTNFRGTDKFRKVCEDLQLIMGNLN